MAPFFLAARACPNSGMLMVVVIVDLRLIVVFSRPTNTEMASATFHPLNEHGREDRFVVPSLFPGEDYVFDADHIIVVKDKAQAATNAIGNVFNGKVYEAMCVTHASIRWFSVNASKFHDIANKNRCVNDINHAYKILGHVNFVEVGRRLLMEKWVNVYREPLVARDWLASWGSDHLCRVENCAEHLCPLRGGIPCDNNALEAGNAADKESLVYKKSNLFDFVDNVATKIIHPASMMDTMFEGRLKNRTQTRMNTAVYNINYFKGIAGTECLDMKGFPTYMFLQFDYIDIANDVPKGSFLVAGAHCLAEMRCVEGIDNRVFEDKKLAKKWLAGTGRDPLSWVNIYKNIVKDPEHMTSDSWHTFDVFNGWNKCFHIVRPIIPDNGGRTERAIRYYVEWMTDINHFPMISPDEVVSRKHKGLVSCNCFAYLHYCFCKHTFAVLRKRKIILGFPPTMFPVPVNKRKRAGRPRDMHRGEALNRDG